MSSSRLCVRVRLCEIRLFCLVLLLFCFCLSRKSFVCFFLWSYMCFVSVCRKVRLFCMSVVLLLVYFCLSRISFFSVVLLVFGFWFVGKVVFCDFACVWSSVYAVCPCLVLSAFIFNWVFVSPRRIFTFLRVGLIVPLFFWCLRAFASSFIFIFDGMREG